MGVPVCAKPLVLALLTAAVHRASARVLEEKKHCVNDASGKLWTCVYGQCTGFCADCWDQCNPGGGTCYRRLANETGSYGEMDDKKQNVGSRLQPSNTTNQDWIRYCKCKPGFIGSSCEIEINPWIPVLYALLGVVGTTVMSVVLLDGLDVFMGKSHVSHIMDHMNEVGESGSGKVPMSDTTVYTAVANCAVQHFMMASGSFAYSVPWTHDFFLIRTLRTITQVLLGAARIVADWIVPDDWTAAETFMMQMLVASCGPILLLATAFVNRKNTGHHKEFNEVGAFICFGVLPLLTIPTVSVLFRPIVGCHLQLDTFNPQPIAPEDMRRRTLTPEETFLPMMQRTDCSYGSATWSYFAVGSFILLPFWMFNLYIAMKVDEKQTRFPMVKGYHIMHTQMMVLCAMSYRAFKQHHPKFMSCALLLWNLCEIVFVHYWKPHNRRLLNEVRESAAILAVAWTSCAVIACFIDDEQSYVSGIILTVAFAAWIGLTVHKRWKSTAADGDGADGDVVVVEGEELGEQGYTAEDRVENPIDADSSEDARQPLSPRQDE